MLGDIRPAISNYKSLDRKSEKTIFMKKIIFPQQSLRKPKKREDVFALRNTSSDLFLQIDRMTYSSAVYRKLAVWLFEMFDKWLNSLNDFPIGSIWSRRARISTLIDVLHSEKLTVEWSLREYLKMLVSTLCSGH